MFPVEVTAQVSSCVFCLDLEFVAYTVAHIGHLMYLLSAQVYLDSHIQLQGALSRVSTVALV